MDKLTPGRRSENMRSIKSVDTSPEMKVRRIVHGLGYRYSLHSSDLPGKPDLVFRTRKKVIFVHGCFWHCHQGCQETHVPKSHRGYWRPKLKRNKARDRENQVALEAIGWRILVFWECETNNPKAIARKAREFLR